MEKVKRPVKIVIFCLGNVDRSPATAACLRYALEKRGISAVVGPVTPDEIEKQKAKVVITSAGIGEPGITSPSKRMQEQLTKMGIPFTVGKSRSLFSKEMGQITKEMSEADLILALEVGVTNSLRSWFRGNEAIQRKLRTLRNYALGKKWEVGSEEMLRVRERPDVADVGYMAEKKLEEREAGAKTEAERQKAIEALAKFRAQREEPIAKKTAREIFDLSQKTASIIERHVAAKEPLIETRREARFKEARARRLEEEARKAAERREVEEKERFKFRTEKAIERLRKAKGLKPRVLRR